MAFNRSFIAAGLGAFALLGVVASAGAEVRIANHTPALTSRSTDLGAVDPAGTVRVTLWLKPHARSLLSDTVAAQAAGQVGLLSNTELLGRHAPSAAELGVVVDFLRSQGLTIEKVGAGNLFVIASGSASVVQATFAVELRQFAFRGKNFHANTAAPSLPDAVAPLVASVGGLTSLGMRPMLVRPERHEAVGTPRAIGTNPNGFLFAAQCFYGTSQVSASGAGASATYSGNVYGADISNGSFGTVAPCGYQPSDLQAAYNLNPLYRAGLDGTGQTIAIVDAYGSTNIQSDLAAFSQIMGLPPADLTVVGTPTEVTYSGTTNAGWADETTIDVEWAHAIAPGAKILLVVAPDNSLDNLLIGNLIAAATPGVSVVSNSWSSWESFTDVPTREITDAILQIASAQGVGINFSSGDAGDESVNLGYSDVDYPASSPYATSIGGVSVGVNAQGHINFQTAWGNTFTRVIHSPAEGGAPYDPPENLGFIGGGGGGTSNVYPAPSFQHALGSNRRMVPDISWVADPYTGVEIVQAYDAQGDLGISVFGGTSVACPMFSALWSIAAQRAGHALGQAAPYLYRLPEGAITDVLAASSSTNVSGQLVDSFGAQPLTSWDLALPLQGQSTFLSALYNSPYSQRWYVLGFGLDSTLSAGPGWDPATGLGVPNGAAFVRAFGRRN
jgi:subtilase family serine protease